MVYLTCIHFKSFRDTAMDRPKWPPHTQSVVRYVTMFDLSRNPCLLSEKARLRYSTISKTPIAGKKEKIKDMKDVVTFK